jgi:hypothetical protein
VYLVKWLWERAKKHVLQLTFKSDDDGKCAMLYVDYNRVSCPELKKMTIIQVRLAWKLLIVHITLRPKTRKMKKAIILIRLLRGYFTSFQNHLTPILQLCSSALEIEHMAAFRRPLLHNHIKGMTMKVGKN